MDYCISGYARQDVDRDETFRIDNNVNDVHGDAGSGVKNDSQFNIVIEKSAQNKTSAKSKH